MNTHPKTTETTPRRSQLTGRERLLRMFARQPGDRLPRSEAFWADTLKRWATEGGPGTEAAVLDHIEADLHSVAWLHPLCFRGQDKIIREDAETYDVLNAFNSVLRYWKDRSGTPQHLSYECDSPDIWHKKFRPALLADEPSVTRDEVRAALAEGRRKGRWSFVGGLDPFEQLRYLIGDEACLYAMIDEPEWIADISRTHTDAFLRFVEFAWEASGEDLDGIWLFGDMAYNSGTLCSPSMYRELIWPDHKRVADWIHARGGHLIFHTDGDVNGVLDLYREAGIDCLQPLECKAGMNLHRLIPDHGRDLAFFGNLDVTVLESGDPERIEAEIAPKLALGKESCGYAVHSDHSIPPRVSWQQFLAIQEIIDRHSWF